MGATLWLLGAAPGAGAFTTIVQERSASVGWLSDVTSDLPFCDGLVTPGAASDAAPDALPFTADVVVDRTVTVETGDPVLETFDCVAEHPSLGMLEAHHDSRIDVDRLSATGGHHLAPLFYLVFNGLSHQVTQQTTAEALYRVRFELTEPTAFTLDGSLTTWAVPGGASGTLALREIGGATLAELTTGSQCLPEIVCPPVPIHASGMLPPGLYELEAGTTGSADTALDFFGVDETSHGEFAVDLVLGAQPVPGLRAGALAAVAALLGGAGVGMLRGHRRGCGPVI